MKKVLVIGGTRFVGRNLIEQMLPLAEYDITLFNRGQTNPHLFPEVKRILGDRDTGDLHKAAQQDWDCIIDISGYYPNPIEDFLKLLKGKVGRYIYVSTTGVYQVYDYEVEIEYDKLPGFMKEDFSKCTYSEADKTDKNQGTYVKRKTACEDVILNQDWLDAIILRPGYIIGPYDRSDRLYHWLYKVKNQETFIIPNEGKNLLSYTDVFDFSRMVIQAIDLKNNYQTYNATSYEASLRELVQTAATHLNKVLQLVNASPAFIETLIINEWAQFPLWVNGNYFTVDNSRLQKDFNFTFSTVDETISRLIDYHNNLKWGDIRERDTYVAKTSMTVEREDELLKLLEAAF